MNDHTQMEAARRGVITEEMKAVASEEKLGVEALRDLVARGLVVIPANKNHRSLGPAVSARGLKPRSMSTLASPRTAAISKRSWRRRRWR